MHTNVWKLHQTKNTTTFRVDKNEKLCFNCLRPHHLASKCCSSTCRNCSRKEKRTTDNLNKSYMITWFVVRLPFKKEKRNSLGKSYSIALKGIFSFQKSLKRHPVIKKNSDFLVEYENLVHMSKVKKYDKTTSRSNKVVSHKTRYIWGFFSHIIRSFPQLFWLDQQFKETSFPY